MRQNVGPVDTSYSTVDQSFVHMHWDNLQV